MEEVSTDVINLTADILIAKDKSEWQMAIDAYVKAGKTEGEAFGLALADQAAAMGLDFLGGAISGGVMSSGGVAINRISNQVQYSGLVNKIKGYVDKLARKIRWYYGSLNPDSFEGRMVGQMSDAIGEIQDKFAEALVEASENYQAAEKNTTGDGGEVKFSIKRTRKMTLKEQLSDYYKRKFKQSDSFYFGVTPSILTKSGLDANPLAFGQDDFAKSTRNKHNIPRRVLNKLSENLAKPNFSFTAGKQAVIVIDDIDGDGKPVVVAIHGGHTMDRMPVNLIKSIYGIDDMNEWVTKQIKGGGKFRVYDIEKANAMLQTQGYLAAVGTQSDGFWDIITDIDPTVNPESLTPGEENAIVEGKRDKNLSAIVDEIQKTLPKTEAEIAAEQVEQADRDLEAKPQYSIRKDIVDVNGKEYDTVVALDKPVRKNVLSSPKELMGYIKRNFIGLQIPVLDGNGNTEIIEFARENETVVKNKKRHPVLGELGYIKGDTRKVVVVNLKEVLEESDYDPIYSSSDNEHGWLDERGWESRKTYVLTDNIIYEAFLKIAKARDGRNILYGVNLDVKKASL